MSRACSCLFAHTTKHRTKQTKRTIYGRRPRAAALWYIYLSMPSDACSSECVPPSPRPPLGPHPLVLQPATGRRCVFPRVRLWVRVVTATLAAGVGAVAGEVGMGVTDPAALPAAAPRTHRSSAAPGGVCQRVKVIHGCPRPTMSAGRTVIAANHVVSSI